MKHFYNMYNIQKEKFILNGTLFTPPSYDITPQEFNGSASNNELYIQSATNNNYTWQHLPTIQNGSGFIIANQGIQSPWDTTGFQTVMQFGYINIQCKGDYGPSNCFVRFVDSRNNVEMYQAIVDKRYFAALMFVKYTYNSNDYIAPVIIRAAPYFGIPTNENYQNYTHISLVEADDPYILAPISETGGGYGNFDYTSDDTDFSRIPTISACDAGFCTLYKLGVNDVKSLADYLWGLGSLASFLPVFSDPMECILSLGIVPVAPVTGTSQYIKVGNLTTTVSGTKITKQFDTFDMGSVTISGGNYSQTFMDYSPYTKAELFLPYIGTVALDIDEIMDSTLHLKYMFDLLSGSCIAELKIAKVYNYKNANHTHTNVLYRYSGNILTNIPITGANYTQMFQAIIGAVATGIGGAAGAQSAKNAIASEAIEDKAALSQISSTTGMKPGIKRAGNLTSACGFMGAQAAEIILSLPKLAHLGKPQGKEFGFPRYAEYTLSDLRGYTRIIQVHLKSIKCTDAEHSMIETALNGGVIVSGTATPSQSAATNTIKVYTYTCDKICLNKADDWSLIDTITGNWRDEKIDILAPTIKIKPTTNLTQAKILTEANYVYIADFNRYYYITGISAESGDCITLSLAIDAPMSWLAGLKTQKVVVDRQEKEWNMYLSDGYIKTYNTPYCVVKKFPTAFTAENFILAVAGGGT